MGRSDRGTLPRRASGGTTIAKVEYAIRYIKRWPPKTKIVNESLWGLLCVLVICAVPSYWFRPVTKKQEFGWLVQMIPLP